MLARPRAKSQEQPQKAANSQQLAGQQPVDLIFIYTFFYFDFPTLWSSHVSSPNSDSNLLSAHQSSIHLAISRWSGREFSTFLASFLLRLLRLLGLWFNLGSFLSFGSSSSSFYLTGSTRRFNKCPKFVQLACCCLQFVNWFAVVNIFYVVFDYFVVAKYVGFSRNFHKLPKTDI